MSEAERKGLPLTCGPVESQKVASCAEETGAPSGAGNGFQAESRVGEPMPNLPGEVASATAWGWW